MADEERGRREAPYTTGQLARELGVNIRTIIRWLEQGVFGEEGIDKDWWRTEGGNRRISVAAVERYKARHTRHP